MKEKRNELSWIHERRIIAELWAPWSPTPSPQTIESQQCQDPILVKKIGMISLGSHEYTPAEKQYNSNCRKGNTDGQKYKNMVNLTYDF